LYPKRHPDYLEIDQCETCTWKEMCERIVDFNADLVDEAYERARDEGYWDENNVYHKYTSTNHPGVLGVVP
jgi:hypothetical protein